MNLGTEFGRIFIHPFYPDCSVPLGQKFFSRWKKNIFSFRIFRLVFPFLYRMVPETWGKTRTNIFFRVPLKRKLLAKTRHFKAAVSSSACVIHASHKAKKLKNTVIKNKMIQSPYFSDPLSRWVTITFVMCNLY